MNVLTPLQRDFLFRFFAQPASAPFVLTGGTALGAFHLQHRISDDIDLFAVAPIGDDELQYSEVLEQGFQAAIDVGMMIEAQVERRVPSAHFHQVFLTRREEPRLKVDLVRDPGPSFLEPTIIDGVRVDSVLNIGVNKVTAVSRLAAAITWTCFFWRRRDSRSTNCWNGPNRRIQDWKSSILAWL